MDPETQKYAVTPEQAADISNRFMHHPPKEDQGARYNEIRSKLGECAGYILERTPVSREQSLAITRLEEAMMFANAAIARNE